MNSRHLVVRIVQPSGQPALPPIKAHRPRKSRQATLLEKFFNIFSGSGLGIVAGLLVYYMLKSSGLDLGGLESSVIIGVPAMLGILTSFVIF